MEQLRVALDARWMQGVPLGGVGRHQANLLSLLAQQADLHLVLDARQPHLNTDLPSTYLRGVAASSTVWMQTCAPRWLRKFDGIFHTPWYGLPFHQPVPMVATIHDIVFETHPEWYTGLREWPFRIQGRWAARTARRILTPSATVRDEILEHYGVAAERVLVAPHGIDPVFSPDTAAALREDLLPESAAGRYLVALGGAVRRQLDVAIQAWRNLRRSGFDYSLVTVGGAASSAEPGLVALRGLSDQEWASVLAGATALIYPTLYEGFGMPASEALASGTPVACARSGALPEVLGDCAQWCDSASVDDICAGVADLLSSNRRQRDLRRAGLRRAASMSWQPAADVTLQAYRDAGSLTASG